MTNSNPTRGGYEAVIAVNTGPRKDMTQFGGSYFFRLSLALARTLKRNGIKFSFWPAFSSYIHIYGTFPKLQSELPTSDQTRVYRFLDLIREAIRTFPQEFEGKKFDLWMTIVDGSLPGLNLANALDLPHVFAYHTSYALKDRIVAFPDYESRYNEKVFPNDIYSDALCKAAAAQPWQDKRAFWRGSLFTDFSRSCLLELGKKYPQYFVIEDRFKGQYVPMTAQVKYKYLIDTRGNAWSSRLQTLLKLGRVIFLVDRPYHDWYFDRLRPLEHYVPVKEDLSDLIEKYCYMERHPELYDKIVDNLKNFVEENLTPRRIVFEAKELILRYGVID